MRNRNIKSKKLTARGAKKEKEKINTFSKLCCTIKEVKKYILASIEEKINSINGVVDEQCKENAIIRRKFDKLKTDMIEHTHSLLHPQEKQTAFWHALENVRVDGPDLSDLYEKQLYDNKTSSPYNNKKKNPMILPTCELSPIIHNASQSSMNTSKGTIKLPCRFKKWHQMQQESIVSFVKKSQFHCCLCYGPITKSEKTKYSCKECSAQMHYECIGREKGQTQCIQLDISSKLCKAQQFTLNQLFNRSSSELMVPEVPELFLLLIHSVMHICTDNKTINNSEYIPPYQQHHINNDLAKQILNDITPNKIYKLYSHLNANKSASCSLIIYLLQHLQPRLLSKMALCSFQEAFEQNLGSTASHYAKIQKVFSLMPTNERDTLFYFLLHLKIVVRSFERRQVVETIVNILTEPSLYELGGDDKSFNCATSIDYDGAVEVIKNLLKLDTREFYLSHLNNDQGDFFKPFMSQ